MNPPGRPRPKKQRKRRQPATMQPVDLWRSVAELAEPEPILPVSDPSAVIRSLGPPPLQNHPDATSEYFAAAIERAATLATALASSAGLLGASSED